MSRIGKIPVTIPKGVTAAVQDGAVTVKGPKGELRREFDPRFRLTVAGESLKVERPSDEKNDRALHGLYRALVQNMMVGVSTGFTRTLEIEGVGYNAKADGPGKLVLNIGFNAPRVLMAPKGVTIETPKPTIIVLKSADKQAVGQFAAEVRGVRPPEPYKGKGIRYQGEHIIRKAGKAIGGKTAG